MTNPAVAKIEVIPALMLQKKPSTVGIEGLNLFASVYEADQELLIVFTRDSMDHRCDFLQPDIQLHHRFRPPAEPPSRRRRQILHRRH